MSTTNAQSTDQKKELNSPADIAWQEKIYQTFGADFCRELQRDIQNLVNTKYNQAVDHCNKILKDAHAANKRAMQELQKREDQ